MKKLFILFAVIFCFTLASEAYACSCMANTPGTAYNDSRAVFVGKMIEGTEKISIPDDANGNSVIEAGTVRFAVNKFYKGTFIKEAVLQIGSMNGTSCGPYGLKRGETYVVYAYGSDVNSLSTGVCTRTHSVSLNSKDEDLHFLNTLPPKGTGGNLTGFIRADLRAGSTVPLANVRVNVRNIATGKIVTARTDKNGEFAATRLKAGKYRVEPILPANYTTEETFREVEIADLGTARTGFEMYLNGRVSGRLLDKDGQPFNSVFLHFEDGEKSTYGHSTNVNGGFIVEGVPPGNYKMYIEMNHPDYSKNTKYYYPGTFDPVKAASIKVGLGSKVENLKFMLPAEYRVRTIEGQVVWEDGTPAANAQVSLGCPKGLAPNNYIVEFSPASVQADANGKFKIEAFTNETYTLQAYGSKAGSKPNDTIIRLSAGRKIALTENLKDLKLTLSVTSNTEGCVN